MKRLQISVTDEEHEYLRKRAFHDRVSIAHLVRDMIFKTQAEDEKLPKIK